MAVSDNKKDTQNIHNECNRRLGGFMYSMWNYMWELIKSNNNYNADVSYESIQTTLERAWMTRDFTNQRHQMLEFLFVDKTGRILGSFTVNCNRRFNEDSSIIITNLPAKKEIIKICIDRPPTFRWIKETNLEVTESDL